jgi:hypothetical protein
MCWTIKYIWLMLCRSWIKWLILHRRSIPTKPQSIRMKHNRWRSPGFGHWMSKRRKWHCCMEFPLLLILTAYIGLWRWLQLLWISASTSNWNIDLMWENWKLRFDLSDLSVWSTFGVNIAFLIFSRRLIKRGLQLFSSWSHLFSTLTNYDIFTFGCLGLRWPNKDFLALKIDYTFWEYLTMWCMPPVPKWSLNFNRPSSIVDWNCRRNTLQSQVLWEKESCHFQYAHFPNDDMTWSVGILILFSNTKISRISSWLEISNVYLILFCRLIWATGFRAEQTNGAESTSTHSTTHILGLSDIVSILFLIEISVSLTSLNT